MKKLLVLFFFLFSLSVSSWAQEEGWKTLKSTHFVVYYKNAPEDFIKELNDKAEHFYGRIADNLGFRRFDFWLWDNRAKIYVYDDANSYRIGSGQPEWSSGVASVANKSIQTFPNASGFMDKTLPHEMTHIIFREFVGLYNYAVPEWLEEGVACSQENGDLSVGSYIIQEGIKKQTFMGIPSLTAFNVRIASNKDLVNLYYAESTSIVSFLLKDFGKDKFVLFCQCLRDNQDLRKAFATAYSFASIDDLNDAWVKYVKNG